MEVKATARYVRLSPSKARDLTRRMQGKPVSEALKVTELSERKAAFEIGKALKAAIANAQNNAKLSTDDLVVKQAVINEGPRLKRFWPRARGMVSPVKKKTCHICIVLTDGESEA